MAKLVGRKFTRMQLTDFGIPIINNHIKDQMIPAITAGQVSQRIIGRGFINSHRGYIIPVYYHISAQVYSNNGLQYCGLIRPYQTLQQYIFISQEGNIEGFYRRGWL